MASKEKEFLLCVFDCKRKEKSGKVVYLFPQNVLKKLNLAWWEQVFIASYSSKISEFILVEDITFMAITHDHYLMVLGTNSKNAKELLEYRSKTLKELLGFFCGNSFLNGSFDSRLQSVLDEFVRMIKCGENLVSNIYLLAEDGNNAVLKSSDFLKCFMKIGHVLGSVILYKNSVINTLLDHEICKVLVLSDPYRMKSPALEIVTEFELPLNVQIFEVFISETQFTQLKSAARKFSIEIDGQDKPFTKKVCKSLSIKDYNDSKYTTGHLNLVHAKESANSQDKLSRPYSVCDPLYPFQKDKRVPVSKSFVDEVTINLMPKNELLSSSDKRKKSGQIEANTEDGRKSMPFKVYPAKWEHGSNTAQALPPLFTKFNGHRVIDSENATIGSNLSKQNGFSESLSNEHCASKEMEEFKEMCEKLRKEVEEELKKNGYFDEKQIPVVMHVCGHEEIAMITLLEKEVVRNETALNELWELSERQLPILEAKLREKYCNTFLTSSSASETTSENSISQKNGKSTKNYFWGSRSFLTRNRFNGNHVNGQIKCNTQMEKTSTNNEENIDKYQLHLDLF